MGLVCFLNGDGFAIMRLWKNQDSWDEWDPWILLSAMEIRISRIGLLFEREWFRDHAPWDWWD